MQIKMQCATVARVVLVVLLIAAPLATVLAMIQLPADLPPPPYDPYDAVCLHGRYCGGACERRGPWEDALDMACWEHYLCTLDAGLDIAQTCRCDVDLLDEAERHNDTDLARAMLRALEAC